MKLIRILPLIMTLVLFAGCSTQKPTVHESKPQSKSEPDKFYILYTIGEVDFEKAPKAYISTYSWGKEYTPEAYAQVVFKEGDGFYVHMECSEINPLAVNNDFNDPICEDSCMEFFADYVPKSSNGSYINVEMNANGAFLCYFCKDVPNGDYDSIADVSDVIPTVTSFKTETSWGVNLHMPLEVIEAAFGSSNITLGSYIKCNFYKCGEKTEIKHYGAWNEVVADTPNFHLPEYFAEVQIKEN